MKLYNWRLNNIGYYFFLATFFSENQIPVGKKNGNFNYLPSMYSVNRYNRAFIPFVLNSFTLNNI